MSSLVGAAPAQQIPGIQAEPRPDRDLRSGVVAFDEDLSLHFGGKLAGVVAAWHMDGAADAPVVVALGGISAGRYVMDHEGIAGWWSEIVGPALALDSQKFRILGLDFLGGSGATTGPAAGQTDFPAISAYDQAEVLRRVLASLHIPRAHAIVGASYGGMVALAFAERWPDLVERIVSISAADRSHPMSTAWRSVQREMVRYALAKGDGPGGLRLARALAMATYRSSEEFDERFSGSPMEQGGRFTFPVENYLLARGDDYAGRYLPEAFVCLSESIDLHRVQPAQIAVPTTLIAVREDQLVPVQHVRALRGRLAGPAELFELSSRYGHDAFLKEANALRSIFAQVLGTSGEVV